MQALRVCMRACVHVFGRVCLCLCHACVVVCQIFCSLSSLPLCAFLSLTVLTPLSVCMNKSIHHLFPLTMLPISTIFQLAPSVPLPPTAKCTLEYTSVLLYRVLFPPVFHLTHLISLLPSCYILYSLLALISPPPFASHCSPSFRSFSLTSPPSPMYIGPLLSSPPQGADASGAAPPTATSTPAAAAATGGESKKDGVFGELSQGGSVTSGEHSVTVTTVA